VLVGDSGHFKDPTPGWGIADAFRQLDALVPAIVDNFDGDLDGALRSWGQWRNEDAFQHYWLANDLGRTGPMPAPIIEAAKRLFATGRGDDFIRVFLHRAMPFDALTRRSVIAATGRLLIKGGDRRAVLREVRGIVSDDRIRQRLNRSPAYAQGAEVAAETEVD
jgi:2-polyprenyl-6-methoxyphenol hydroxylase-like FAD-dependent oxidoreductase